MKTVSDSSLGEYFESTAKELITKSVPMTWGGVKPGTMGTGSRPGSMGPGIVPHPMMQTVLKPVAGVN